MIENIDKMNGWSIEELPNLVFFQEGPGVRNNQYTDSGVKLLNVANLKDGNVHLDNTDRYISEEEAYGKYSHFLVDEGDLIIASSGIKVEYFDKKMGFAKKEHLPLCMNTSTIRFKTLDDTILNIEYFAYFLKTNYFKKQISRLITGSAQLNFGPSHLKQIKVILPPIDVQKKIVEVLDKAQELIDKRKEQIDVLDELVKSRFIEMFGDPIKNPKNLEKVYLKDISELITKGSSPNWQGIEYVEDESQTLFVTSENVREGYIDLSKKKYLMDEFNDKQKRSILKKGDFLINIVGASIGRAAQFNLDTKANINQAVALVRIKKGLINDKYLLTYLNSPKALAMYESMQVSVARANLSLQNINDLEILLPQIELQNEFAYFVKQVEKLKTKMETSLKELEDNFNSLMQKAFKGELF